MSFFCFICQAKLTTIDETCSHLRRKHGLFEGKLLSLKCCTDSCQQTFQNYKSFREHLRNHLIFESNPLNLSNIDDVLNKKEQHSNIRTSIKRKASSSEILTENSGDLIEVVNTAETQNLISFNSVSENFQESYFEKPITHSDASSGSQIADSLNIDEQTEKQSKKENLFQKFIMKLDSSSLPKATVNKIVEETSYMLDSAFDDIGDIYANDPSSFSENLREYVNNQRESYKDVSSTYRRNKMSSIDENFIKPTYLTIGTRKEEIYDEKTGVYKSIPVPCKVAYIPILQTVKFVLSNKYVMQEILKDTDQNTEFITSFRDGLYYQRHLLFKLNKSNVALLFYFDEFETVNPLGSKTGGHKLGAIYCTFRNLPNEFNACLENIMLVALFYSADIKTCGMSNILRPLIDDLKIFESRGIPIGEYTIRGTIAAFSFDNLGGNMLYALPESFANTYYCRICTVSYEEAKTMILEKEEYLRSEILNPRCEDDEFSRTIGCKFETIFSELSHFDPFDCLSVDIAHDLPEGLLQLEIKLFLKEAVEVRKLIKLIDLNERIKIFSYGINESKNKPSPIVLKKPGNRVGQRAAQTRCLSMYLPLILSDVLKKAYEKSDPIIEKWEVLKLLLQIMQIVYSPVFSNAMVAELKELIVQHHSLFLQFLGDHLLPKHHFLLHYPLVIKLMGPLIFLWTLRFEGKHNYFKDLVHKMKNFINVIKTLAEQHQKFIYEQWINCDKRVEQVVSAKSGKYVLFEECLTKNGIDNIFLKDFPKFVYKVEKLSFRVEYRVGFFITKKENSSEFPFFFKIVELFVACNSAYAICKPYETVEYDDIYLGYKIEPKEGSTKIICDLKTLTHVISYELHQPYHTTDYYIIPKYRIN
ncbi:uncharacterized protein LOC127283564 [Leptopilina boulardi]|uniref:uncharacterized protein LOC127283564 n=1 Tax=Leptopilina boulardi TaxID=63433 RepID=UPI0021F51D98|nr:uncharacterized protein LOC127283564 [Leptopilina boulardi]